MKKTKQARVPRTKSLAGRGTSMYAAVHENKLGLWLAGGYVSPWPKGAAIEDHHTAACSLVLERGKPSPTALLAARGRLRYGAVAAVEVDPERAGAQDDPGEPVTVLPAVSIKRVAFANQDQASQFDARMSGYADVPPGLIDVVVDPSLFDAAPVDATPPGGASAITSTGTAVPVGADGAKSHGIDPEPLRAELDTLDRLAGSLAAACWAVEHASKSAPGTSIANGLAGLAEAMSESPTPVAVASLVDTDGGASQARPVIESLVRVLLLIPREDVLSPVQVLADLRAQLVGQLDVLPDIVARFLDFSESVVSQQRDLGNNAYSDENGSITLRAILLFLLNPDPDRMDAVLERNSNVGPRVFSVAASLVGFHAGFSLISGAPKSNVRRTLTIPRMVMETRRRVAPSCQLLVRWDEGNGSRITALTWRDTELVAIRAMADPMLDSLVAITRKAGYLVSFRPSTGRVLIKQQRGAPDLAGQLVAAGPVFPRRPAIELSIESDFTGSRKQLSQLVSDIQSHACEDGVFASEVVEKKLRRLKLVAYVADPLSEGAVAEAIKCLAQARGTGVTPPASGSGPAVQDASLPVNSSGELFPSS